MEPIAWQVRQKSLVRMKENKDYKTLNEDGKNRKKGCLSYFLFVFVLICSLLGLFYIYEKETQLTNLQHRMILLEERMYALEYSTAERDDQSTALPQWYSDGPLQFSKPTLDARNTYDVINRPKRSADPKKSRWRDRRTTRRPNTPYPTQPRYITTRRTTPRARVTTPYPTQPRVSTPYPTQPTRVTPPSPVPPVGPYPPSPVPPVRPYPPSPVPPVAPQGPGYPGTGYPGTGHPGAGYPAPGYPRPGYPAPGYPAPGYPAPGYPGTGYPAPGYPAPGYPGTGFPGTGYPGGAIPFPATGYKTKKKKDGTIKKIGKAVAIGGAAYLGAKAAKKGLKLVGKLGKKSISSMLLPHHRFRVKSHRRMKIDIDNDNINVYGFNGVTAAAHYEAYTQEEDKRVLHEEDTFRNWKKSFWMTPLDMDKSFSMTNGVASVLESGLYLIYAQVHFVEKAFISGYKIFVDDDPVAQCVTMATTNLTATKHNTCFTSTLTFIGEYSRVYLTHLETPRTSMMVADSTFFGLINLGDPRTVLLQDYSRVDWD